MNKWLIAAAGVGAFVSSEAVTQNQVEELSAKYELAMSYIKEHSVDQSVVTKALRSHVSIEVMDAKQQRASGSGEWITADGLILTNAHVVGGAAFISITDHQGRTFTAHIVKLDAGVDLALIQIDGEVPTDIEPIKFATEAPEQGDLVITIGDPLRLHKTVNSGIVSYVGRPVPGRSKTFIQIDAMISPGNSGGMLLNSRGEMIGVNAMMITYTGGTIGLNLAIPMETVNEFLKGMI